MYVVYSRDQPPVSERDVRLLQEARLQWPRPKLPCVPHTHTITTHGVCPLQAESRSRFLRFCQRLASSFKPGNMLLLNQPHPVEGIKHRQENTKLLIHQEVYGPGTLYIAESHVSWVKDGAEQHTLSLAYPHIAIHAVSRDTSNQNQPCLCLIVDTIINLPWVDIPNINTEAESSDEEDEDTACTEVKFIPTDPMSLEPMYQALNECQTLHPDPQDQSDDDAWPEDDEENFEEGEYEVNENGYPTPYDDDMEGVDDMARVGSQPITTTNHLDQEAEGETEEAMETGQFDDADD